MHTHNIIDIIIIISEKCFSDAMDGYGGAEKDQSKRDQTMLLRPLSMNIAHDQAGNPYVDLPSKVGTTTTASLLLPPEAAKAKI